MFGFMWKDWENCVIVVLLKWFVRSYKTLEAPPVLARLRLPPPAEMPRPCVGAHAHPIRTYLNLKTAVDDLQSDQPPCWQADPGKKVLTKWARCGAVHFGYRSLTVTARYLTDLLSRARKQAVPSDSGLPVKCLVNCRF